jgi:hypothetical protein
MASAGATILQRLRIKLEKANALSTVLNMDAARNKWRL